MNIFRHVDGRVMKRTAAGGTGGGVTSHFDELATAEEIAAFERDEAEVEADLIDKPVEHDPVAENMVVPEPALPAVAEARPAEAAPNA